jgi:hypothetical protein
LYTEMNLKDIGHEDVHWIHLVPPANYCKLVTKCRVP